MVVKAGATFIISPVPIADPPQLPEYHFQLAPDPKEPPETLSVVVSPWQISDLLAEADVGASEGVPIAVVILAQTQSVLLQSPLARSE